MVTYYSPSKNGFYNSSVQSDIPTDAIEISQEQWLSLRSAQSSGMIISIVDGLPIASQAASNLASDLAALAAEYKADVTALNQSWLSSAVLGGSSEGTKKNAVKQELTDRKTRYLADVAAARAKYA